MERHATFLYEKTQHKKCQFYQSNINSKQFHIIIARFLNGYNNIIIKIIYKTTHKTIFAIKAIHGARVNETVHYKHRSNQIG